VSVAAMKAGERKQDWRYAIGAKLSPAFRAGKAMEKPELETGAALAG